MSLFIVSLFTTTPTTPMVKVGYVFLVQEILPAPLDPRAPSHVHLPELLLDTESINLDGRGAS